jgi:hypothetical protein
MTRLTNILSGTVIFVLLLCPSAFAGDYRLTVTVADVMAQPDDTLIAVPVHISHPHDTLAGIELYFKLDQNRILSFASDETRKDGMLVAADTAGTILSGWEYLGINSLEKTTFDLKLVGMAEWPDDKVTPPALPTDKGLLVTLYFRFLDKLPLQSSARIEIPLIPEKTSFADPTGNTVGLVTTTKKVCSQFAGDSCVAWKRVKSAYLDTAVVHLQSGSITVTDAATTGQ